MAMRLIRHATSARVYGRSSPGFTTMDSPMVPGYGGCQLLRLLLVVYWEPQCMTSESGASYIQFPTNPLNDKAENKWHTFLLWIKEPPAHAQPSSTTQAQSNPLLKKNST